MMKACWKSSFFAFVRAVVFVAFVVVVVSFC